MKSNPYKEAIYKVIKEMTLSILDRIDGNEPKVEILGRGQFKTTYKFLTDDVLRDMINYDYLDAFEEFKEESVDECIMDIENLIEEYCDKKKWALDKSDDKFYTIYPSPKSPEYSSFIKNETEDDGKENTLTSGSDPLSTIYDRGLKFMKWMIKEQESSNPTSRTVNKVECDAVTKTAEDVFSNKVLKPLTIDMGRFDSSYFIKGFMEGVVIEDKETCEKLVDLIKIKYSPLFKISVVRTESLNDYLSMVVYRIDRLSL